jgi:hypothetical protein
MLKLAVVGGLPEFIIDVASSGGISVFCCTLCPALIPNAEMNNKLVFANIDMSNIDAVIVEKKAIFVLSILAKSLGRE